jgi:phosphate transport system protein
MSQHLSREIENLKKKLLALGAKVEEAVQKAAQSIEQRDRDLAIKVIENDPDIDQSEIEVEEDCLKILALHQPVAIDLRFIVAVLKINNDLERIGDLAVNIAERAVFLESQPKVNISIELVDMAHSAQSMLKKSIDALVNHDAKLAHKVCTSDDVVDDMNRQMYLKVQDAIVENPEQIKPLIHLLSASRHLERIADHTTNIAEDVIYMIEGQIVRHKTEEYK